MNIKVFIEGVVFMKILIYGAGVLGAYVAYELKRVGHEVTILARGRRYEELKEKGVANS